jgi:hypothetical protein
VNKNRDMCRIFRPVGENKADTFVQHIVYKSRSFERIFRGINDNRRISEYPEQ